ncbi:ABC transporter ATP-binding protein [Propioniciclava soli]|uniref:ABC transporter ATP-binding protein n=1 Tax=Propioniciclava soli TaxID=2775081 RepID=UPI001E5CA573|nr:ABC transporter ATP-binding protein [Propioniciclava soli]
MKPLTQGLVARDLCFSYDGRRTTIVDWSAVLAPGQVTAITGASGSGKSTLLYLLGLMLTPGSGSVLIDGERVDTLGDTQRAALRSELFGFVFQDAALDATRTVADNVTEPVLYRRGDRKAASGRVPALLAAFGVDVPVDRRPGQVSGGQAQRIALCRALIGEPSIVLADEPTGNLDPESSAVVLGALRQHARDGGVVAIVTHSDAVAASCDQEIRL